MKNILAAIKVLWLMGLVLPGVLAAQRPQNKALADGSYEFSIKTSIVNVSFTVQDKNGHAITGLTKEDFLVLEDSQNQEIKYFSREPDEPLHIALLFDKSKSVLGKFRFMQEAATDFLNSLVRKEKDRAMLVAFDEDVQILQPLTNEISFLSNKIHSMQAVGGTSLFDAVYETSQILSQQVGTARKVIILVTDGEDTTSYKTLKEALALALESDINIYAIGVKTKHSLNNRNMRGAPVLENLTELTGGKAFFPSREDDKLSAAFKQVEDQLRNQYSIGYASSNGVHDGKFRKIEIVTTQNKGYKVHARRGYFASLIQ